MRIIERIYIMTILGHFLPAAFIEVGLIVFENKWNWSISNKVFLMK
jgi:hypothetical protein